jgi:hypothetical protein
MMPSANAPENEKVLMSDERGAAVRARSFYDAKSDAPPIEMTGASLLLFVRKAQAQETVKLADF